MQIIEYSCLSYSHKHGGYFCKICVLFDFEDGGRSRVKLAKKEILKLMEITNIIKIIYI